MVKYGHVRTANDISEINKDIRANIRHATTEPHLRELVRESAYLITLTYSPAWRHISTPTMRARAKHEYTITATLANQKLGHNQFDMYWGNERR